MTQSATPGMNQATITHTAGTGVGPTPPSLAPPSTCRRTRAATVSSSIVHACMHGSDRWLRAVGGSSGTTMQAAITARTRLDAAPNARTRSDHVPLSLGRRGDQETLGAGRAVRHGASLRVCGSNDKWRRCSPEICSNHNRTATSQPGCHVTESAQHCKPLEGSHAPSSCTETEESAAPVNKSNRPHTDSRRRGMP
jgi:hypothetical protein